MSFPIYLTSGFTLIVLVTIVYFLRASRFNPVATALIALATLAHGILAFNGFYLNTRAVPPRFLFVVLPTIVFFLVLANSTRGKQYLKHLDLKQLTLLHTVRLPVELLLYGLYRQGAIPELMTFNGRNFDIIIGISAPIIYYFVFVRKSLSIRRLYWWNWIGLGLLLNIVMHAILSAPLPIQQFAFDQPNVAVLYLPFVWLPAVVVPIVFAAHLAVLLRKPGELTA